MSDGSRREECVCRTGYTRVIVEKPFGKDSESFRQLSTDLYQHLTEDQMYRIDHYLGKELIENLTVCSAPLTPSQDRKHSSLLSRLSS